ncbi:efflux transporter outer membrane subunit [Falsirhodobacter deserti]|uniref:efflux transporter outer membrane subunit n=1 Tax=Falsirhodobacter deserti TaxID=1365611 RepID=UPI000FE2FD6E|nr:efflux transporter outer membrane subunit [Falsirhodobacter deserti]
MIRPILLLLMLSTAGCAVGPDYTAPQIRLASTFAEGSAGPIGEVASRRWWTAYNDPVLNDLVARGLAQNLDLAAANERIAAAEASLRQTGLSASVDGGVSASSSRRGGAVQAAGTQSATTLNAQFVIDLFGGVRRARQAALANLGAAEADVGVTRLAYLSAILGAYIDARYNQNALELTRRTIATRERTLEITQNQRASGAATELDEAQVQALLDDARANLPALEAAFLSNVYAIATLLAEPAQPLVARMQAGAPQPRPRNAAAIGIPADLVRNRPDVRQAERQLAQSVAQVGVATAQLYPSVTLSGSVTEGGTDAWSFGPSLAQAIFNQPQLRAARDESLSAARQAEIAWRQSVLDAVEDVQSANSTFRRDGRTVALLARSVASYERALTLSQQNFEAGALSLLDLLDTDRSLANARLGEASAVRDQAVDYATLQIALGAGAYPAP